MLTRKVIAHARRRLPGLRQTTTVFDGGRSRVNVDLGTALGMSLYCGVAMDVAETQLLAARLRPGDGFVDVGANVGLYTLVAAAQVGPTGRVTAFEPSVATRRQLQANVELNRFGDRVRVRSEAASDRSGRATITSFSGDRAGFSSMVPPTDFGGGRTEAIDTVRLDDEFPPAAGSPPVRLVKIDVEGAEVAVLAGAGRLLSTDRPDLIVEAEPDNLARYGQTVASLLAAVPAGYAAFRIGLRDGSVQLTPFELSVGGSPAGGCNLYFIGRPHAVREGRLEADAAAEET